MTARQERSLRMAKWGLRHPMLYGLLVSLAVFLAGSASFRDWRGALPFALVAGIATYILWRPGGAVARSVKKAIADVESDGT